MVGAMLPVASCWIILLSPLVATALIVLWGIPRPRFSIAVAVGGLLASFLAAVHVFLAAVAHPAALPFESSVDWLAMPELHVPFGILVDSLSLLMTLVVTGVGSVIVIYSIGYMTDDRATSRFFGVMSLFAFSMLTIVLSTNWVQLFMGWELVGCCSYLLIGHWYAKPAAAEAGKKAFMVNRVADFAFLLGILLLWSISNPVPAERTLHFRTLEQELPVFLQANLIPAALLPVIGLLLFCGPMGKSAQFPLHVWLPDAMEGPTPVSALIHAATMVAAGVYLLCRTFWLFAALPGVLTTIMWVGGATAFLSACLALVEHDLKRILAYSTLSQLGYMVMALGLGGHVAGMYHLTTHAFFKALLFLAAGSVIHGTHEQDIRRLGGLRRSMPWTSAAFCIGGLALCGAPGLSGFFSKDEILVLAHAHAPALYWLGTLTAGLTALYIARAWFVAFTGAPARGNPHGTSSAHTHIHESPPIMLIPLCLLAILSVAGGYVGIPGFLGESHGTFHWSVAITSTLVVAAGLTLAWLIYKRKAMASQQVVHALALPRSFLERRYYIDEIYTWYVTRIQQRILAGWCATIERYVIIGCAVNGVARLTQGAGWLLRFCQTGKVQTYALVFFIGVLWIVAATPR